MGLTPEYRCVRMYNVCVALAGKEHDPTSDQVSGNEGKGKYANRQKGSIRMRSINMSWIRTGIENKKRARSDLQAPAY